MTGYDVHSETERVLVDNEGLVILSLLKIQSGRLGNLAESPFDGDKFCLKQAGAFKVDNDTLKGKRCKVVLIN